MSVQSQAFQLLIAESRINLLRVVAVALLYAQHTFSYYVLKDASLSDSFHQGVNGVVLGCCLLIATVYLMLGQKAWPIWMTYATILCDGVLITWLILLAGGPAKIQIALLPLLIAVSSLRLLKSAVWWSTGVAVMSYLLALANFVFVDVGWENYYSESQSDMRISRHDELFFVLALLIMGFIADQIVRQTYRVAQNIVSSVNLDTAVDPGESTSHV